jgi:malonate transporter
MAIIAAVFPVFAITLVGYIVARLKVLSALDIDGLSRFVFYIAIPVLLFNSMAHMELTTGINWHFLLSYYLIAVSIYIIGMYTSRLLFSGSLKEQGIYGLGCSYSNLILVGLPIILAGFGEAGLLPLFVLVGFHSTIMFFIATLIVEREVRSEGSPTGRVFRQTTKNLIQNPIIVSLALGLTINLLHLPVPDFIAKPLDILSKATLPCALFVLGASMNAYSVSGHFKETWVMIGLKMAVQPFLVWLLAFQVFHLDPLWGSVAVMAAGMPIGINTFIFAQKYQVGVATLSTAILLSTLIALFSQTFLLSVFI